MLNNNFIEISSAVTVRNFLRNMLDSGLLPLSFKDKKKIKEFEDLLSFLDEEIFNSSFVALKKLKNEKNNVDKVDGIFDASIMKFVEEASKETNKSTTDLFKSVSKEEFEKLPKPSQEEIKKSLDEVNLHDKNKNVTKKGSFRKVSEK